MGSISTTFHTHLDALLNEVLAQYNNEHPLSRISHEEATKYMPGGNTRTVLYNTPFPLTIASAKSCYLTTVDGHQYVDFLSEYTAAIYGHNHPVIRQSIEIALSGGWNYGAHNVMEQKLAQIVCDRFPCIELIRFVNSGTEANMMALATAVAFTGKKIILMFNKGYHGSTISGQVNSKSATINLPHDFVIGRYNDIEGTKKLLMTLPPKSLAAILVEPMLGSGGCYAGSAEFLNTLRMAANDHKALLIFDEVMTSRLSYHGYGHHVGITPDLMTFGKWMGGGMSFGAFGGREGIMKLYDPRLGQLDHPGTFNNNVFSMAAGVAGCTLLSKDVLGKLNSMGDQMRQSITELLKTYRIEEILPMAPLDDEMHSSTHQNRPPKFYIQGVGSLMCIHFAGPDRQELQALFFHHMLKQGFYLAPRGFIALNIELTKEHIEDFVAAVDRFCKDRHRDLRW